MLSDFLININRLGCEKGRVLLAVSGGVDSVVMSRLFKEAGVNCGIAHCNFQLRGDESDADAALVRRLSGELGFPFHEISFDTKATAARLKMSTQMTARKLRYDWFQTLADQYDYSHIATAHHAGDQVETVLLNLTRGAGIHGLQGIAEKNERVIRPLLFATRDEILKYAEEGEIVWREDKSNSDDYYRRNRIRKHVVPVLKSINPSLENTVSEMVTRLKEAETLLTATLNGWKQSVWNEENGQIKISIRGIKNAVSPRYQLFFLLEPLGFGSEQTNAVYSSLGGLAGKEFHSERYLLIKDREFLVIREKSETGNEESLIEIDIQISPRTDESGVETDRRSGFFDADLLKMPLRVRRWQRGDVFKPFGMNGRKKKVSDLLIDQKLSRLDKEDVKVLVDGDEQIIWVIGLRNDHTTRVTPATKNIAKISVLDPEF